MKRFVEGEDRNQGVLLPEYLDDYVAEENLVRVIDVFVDELDLTALRFEGVVPEATLHTYWTTACAGCPLKAQCTTSKQPRRVKRWEHEAVDLRLNGPRDTISATACACLAVDRAKLIGCRTSDTLSASRSDRRFQDISEWQSSTHNRHRRWSIASPCRA